MKKRSIIHFLPVALLLFTASLRLPTEFSPAHAVVNQEQGLYIFVDSKPASEYEYLGTVKSNGLLGGPQYADVKKRLIAKVKKEYPKANGIILNFNNGGSDSADAIEIE